MNNLNVNEKCLLLYNELSIRKGVKRTKLTKAQLADEPYTLTCDSHYVGGKKANEVIIKGSVIADTKSDQQTVCLLVRNLDTDVLCIKVLDAKFGLRVGLEHMIKISYDKYGVQQSFLQRKEAVYKGSLSAFCKPTALQEVVNYVTSPDFAAVMA